MIKKLLLGACITTPLIVLNAALALYFQGGMSVEDTFRFGVVISLYVSSIWFVNIVLVSRVRLPQHWQLYLVSFVLIIFLSFPVRLLARSLLGEGFAFAGVPVYPFINALVVNGIIWVIIELVRSGELRKEAQTTIDKLKIENLEAQKQSLIRQIQPHFLFNALSTLKSLIAENAKDAEAYTVKLSSFLRYAFTNESADLTKLAQELEYVQNYIELQVIRFEDAFTYEINIPEEALTHQLPVFALQTLVENIFKHNYFSEKKPLHFTISYTAEQLTVWNKKVGLKLTERNETGLLNLRKRYQLTNGSDIEIVDGEDSFAVTIPLIVSV
ncbi:MAG: histidine kinase [Bacteroidota bacterium]